MRDIGHGDWLKAATSWNFKTALGRVDVLFSPPGGGDYAELARSARVIDFGEGAAVLVASLDDLIAMKEAANRPKDQLALPILRWLRARERGETYESNGPPPGGILPGS